MRRVLLLIKGLGRGGAEQLLVNAAPYLDRSRFEYRIAYLLPWKDALVDDLEKLGISSHCLGGGRSLAWIRRLHDLVRKDGIDLVHGHSPLPAVGARLSLPGAIQQVYTEHGAWEHYHRGTYWANLLTFPHNDYVFAVSAEVSASIRYPTALQIMRMPRVETLYHGIDPASVSGWNSPDGVRDELGIPNGAPVVGTVANFRALKGHGQLLRAALHVRREIPEVRFVLVGRGPLEGAIRREALELGLDGTVVFAGFRTDAPRVASAFDVFVLPSLHEGLSIALLEAMALGKPSVVTRVGGVPEVIQPEREGLLVPPGDAVALARAILSLLRDSQLRARLGKAARRRAAEFDIRRTVRRIEAVYEELLR